MDTYEPVCGACVRDGVEDGAEGGWYLVGGREIRAGKRGSSNSLRARSNREEAGERQEAESRRVREGRNLPGGCFACSHPLLAVLFKKLASSLRERYPPTPLYRAARLGSRTVTASSSEREGYLFGVHSSKGVIALCALSNLYGGSKNRTIARRDTNDGS